MEPVWYIPVIPMVLVNGADGIGTGWMTKIPNHNPREIIKNLQRMIKGDEPIPMVMHTAFGNVVRVEVLLAVGFHSCFFLLFAETMVQKFQR